jgi:DNA-binding GntR family transcriptional regulator
VVPTSRQDLIDIYDAQAYFAGELAGRAALHLTEQDIEQLYVMQHAIVAAIDRGDAEAERVGRPRSMIAGIGCSWLWSRQWTPETRDH